MQAVVKKHVVLYFFIYQLEWRENTEAWGGQKQEYFLPRGIFSGPRIPRGKIFPAAQKIFPAAKKKNISHVPPRLPYYEDLRQGT